MRLEPTSLADLHVAGDVPELIGKEEPNGTGQVATPLGYSHIAEKRAIIRGGRLNPPRLVTVTRQIVAVRLHPVWQ